MIRIMQHLLLTLNEKVIRRAKKHAPGDAFRRMKLGFHAMIEPMKCIPRDNIYRRFNSETTHIVLYYSSRRKVFFHQRSSNGPATHRLESYRASAGKQINGVCAFHPGANQIEHRLTHSIFHRASALVSAVLNLATSQSATNDSQFGLRSRLFCPFGSAVPVCLCDDDSCCSA